MFKFIDPSFMVLIGAIIGILGGLISGVGAYRAAKNQSQEQIELKNKADEVAESQRELRKKSDEIAGLYQALADSHRELRKKADDQTESQRLLRVKSEEIASLNKEIGAAQIKLSEKSEEIAFLSKEALNSVTGGDSFCYLSYIDPENTDKLRLIIDHKGKYPLYDVNMRIVDVNEFKVKIKNRPFTIDDLKRDMTIKIDNMTPEMSTMTFDELRLPENGDMELNIFITARNGYWIQNLKLKQIDGKWKQRTTVEKQIGLDKKEKLFERYDF